MPLTRPTPPRPTRGLGEASIRAGRTSDMASSSPATTALARSRRKRSSLDREALQRVRDRIASIKPAHFDMTVYFGRRVNRSFSDTVSKGTNAAAAEGSCKSCACIAGHALAVLTPLATIPDWPMMEADKLLGLGPARAKRLFEPHAYDKWFGDHHGLEDVTRAVAVAVLDRLIVTGRIDWRAAFAKVAKEASPAATASPAAGTDRTREEPNP